MSKIVPKELSNSDVNSKKVGWTERLKRFVKEFTFFALVFTGITIWQTWDMLSTDGSVQIDNISLLSLAGEVATLTENDKPTLVYFFAPWCGVCKMSIDNLQGLNTDKIHVVTVALDYDNTQEVAEFIGEQELQVPVLLGNKEVKRQFQVKGYPSYYVLDKNRNVVSKSYGYSTAIGMKLRAWVNG